MKERETIIRQRRTELGLTVAALARSVGVSAAYVSQIETGVRRGSVSVLDAIYAHLGIASDSVVLGVASTARNMPTEDDLVVVNAMSREDIERIASEFTAEHFARATVAGRPIAVDMALSRCSAKVQVNDVNSDSLVKVQGGVVVVSLNKDVARPLHSDDNRFTICHAIGHALLHHRDLKESAGKVCRDKSAPPEKQASHLNIDDLTRIADWQANVFAAALLLPTAAVYSHLDYCRESKATCGVKDIAQHFGVPYEACLARLETLLPELTGHHS